ncbi:MAG: DNA-processing protein DprA [Acidobacteriota bacterium]|nr:DNA-processing protein DprA [Blastocatellia bacterium]MDW8411827.1 DNA-processing protein DprA [Acidobacteriota bacterium]
MQVELVALQLVTGLGHVRIMQLLRRFQTAAGVFRARRCELEAEGLQAASITEITSRATLAKAESLVKRLEAMQARLVTVYDEDYPQLLREIVDPPPLLYCLGNLAALKHPSVAIVGSRRASFYGRHAAEILSFELASYGVTVVSGLARGIDEMAHTAALEAGGQTVAVLGSGLDCIYPKENAGLAERIACQGALLTELPLGTPPLAQNFPYRNRIISGISLGVVVVEAAERSGSLITARLATEQNREVFAVPGQITSPGSFGPHTLIKDGAKLVHTVMDIIDELPNQDIARCTLSTAEELTELERKVYTSLDFFTAKHVDDLVSEELEPATVASCLTALELKGYVKRSAGKYYSKVK